MFTLFKSTLGRGIVPESMKHLLPILLGTLVAACATPRSVLPAVDKAAVAAEERLQQQLALQALLDDYQRLADLSYPLLNTGAAMCQNTDTTRPVIGWLYGNRAAFDAKIRAAATDSLGLNDQLQVLIVAKNSPVANAGIKPGDKIIQVNDYTTTQDDDAGEQLHQWIKQNVSRKQPVNITLLRGEQRLTHTMHAETSCDFHVRLSNGAELNAYADGKNIIIPRGMMRFAAKDIELSVVIAHEIGHNLMDHIDSIRRNAILGFLLDLAAATQGVYTGGVLGASGRYAHSQGFESEADYVSVYLLAQNKQDIQQIPAFWRKMATQHPRNITRSRGRSHPSTAERFVRLQNTVHEVQQKLKHGQLLTPNFQ